MTNSMKLLKAQYLLFMTTMEERQKIGIERYVDALEKRIAELEKELFDIEEAAKDEAV